MKRDMPQHSASVLGTKWILLFKQSLLHIGYGDPALADCMMGGGSASWVQPLSTTPTRLRPRREQVLSARPGVNWLIRSLAMFSTLP